MCPSSEVSTIGKKGRNRMNGLPNDDQRRLTRVSSLQALSATTREIEEEEEELGEDGRNGRHVQWRTAGSGQ